MFLGPISGVTRGNGLLIGRWLEATDGHVDSLRMPCTHTLCHSATGKHIDPSCPWL